MSSQQAPSTEVTVYRGMDGKEIQLSPQDVVTMIAPNATPTEAMVFLGFCAGHGLNPLINEAYLIKYDRNKAAVIVIGKDAYIKRAMNSGRYDGIEAGLIVKDGEGTRDTVGEFYTGKKEDILGGWAKAYVKDQRVPSEARVTMEEYQKDQASWKQIPATMIRKVAVVHALREGFPSLFVGGSFAPESDYGSLAVVEETDEGGAAQLGEKVIDLAPDAAPETTDEPEQAVNEDTGTTTSSEATQQAPGPSRGMREVPPEQARRAWMDACLTLPSTSDRSKKAYPDKATVLKYAKFDTLEAIPVESLRALFETLQSIA